MDKSSLPPKCQTVLEHFVKCANASMLHPLDWERFYEFVNYCHDHRIKLEEEELVRILCSEGFPGRTAQEVGGVYRHIRSFMSGCKRRNYKRLWPKREL
jgi:hypothetical protein